MRAKREKKKRLRATPAKSPKVKMENKRHVAAFFLISGLLPINDPSLKEKSQPDEAAKYLIGDAARRAILMGCYMMFCEVGDAIRNKFLKKGSRFSPPRAEFGNLHSQIACHTLSHVGVALGRADETVAGLLDHWCGQFPLHNAASLLARRPHDWKEINPRAETARTILQEMPFRLQSTEFLLSYLEGGAEHVDSEQAGPGIPRLDSNADPGGEQLRPNRAGDSRSPDLHEELHQGTRVGERPRDYAGSTLGG
jgi:hypothetical protein